MYHKTKLTYALIRMEFTLSALQLTMEQQPEN